MVGARADLARIADFVLLAALHFGLAVQQRDAREDCQGIEAALQVLFVRATACQVGPGVAGSVGEFELGAGANS